MAKRSSKYSNQDLADIVEYEGLGYAIQHYLSWREIADKKMAALWKAADEAMKAVEKALPPPGDGDYE